MKKIYKARFGLYLLAALTVAKLSGQQTYTFTPCGATGSVGPTQAQATASYSSTNLAGAVTTLSTGIQTWTVPFTGNYRIEVRGAQGGSSTVVGGQGATMIGDFALTGGEVLRILVGQMGENGTTASPGGGGGGSYVVRTPYTTTASAIIVAGGGTGAGSYNTNPGLTTNSGGNGGGLGGVLGNGGEGGSRGAGGGGFLTNGGQCTVSTNYAQPGEGFVNGGRGGNRPNNTTCSGTYGVICAGGFGGGASHGGNCIPNGGAGGGYSGGGGSSNNSAGGGGSINQGTNQSNTAGNNSGDGRVLITELCNITLVASGTTNSVNPAICAGQSLTLTTNAISNYSWSTGATSSSLVVSPTSNTVYVLQATSPQSCTAQRSISVTVSAGVPTLSISNPSNNICLGATATLTASGAITYTWTGGITNGQTFTPTATSGYTVTGANGCGTVTASTSVTVAPLQVTVTANPASVCQGLSTILTATSAVNGYTWAQGGNSASVVASPAGQTVYTVTASDGTCSGIGTVTVSTKPNPTLSIVSTSTRVCEGKSATITISGADTYTWVPASISGTIAVVTPTTSTLYQVSGTNSVNCTTGAATVVIVDPAPIVNSNLSSTLICSGGSVVLSATGGTSYVWSHGPTTNTTAVSPTVNTVYTFTGFGSNGCDAAKSLSVNVVKPLLGISASTTVCEGTQVTLNAGPGSNFSWAPFGGGFPSISVSPSVTTTFTASANVTTLGLICASSNTVMVTVNPNPPVTVTAPSTVICRNNPLIITASGASTYSWSNQATTPAITFTSNFTTLQTLTVIGTDANGCSSVASIQVRVNSCNNIAEMERSGNTISVYPNPNKGEFMITATADVELKLINELGQEIKSMSLKGENSRKVSLTGIADGIYFIVDKDGSINRKIVVSK